MSCQVYHQESVIVIIDDDEGFREALEDLLSSFQYATEQFGSADQFMRAVDNTLADCLLVDIDLGEMNGVELVHQLQASGYEFPTIFMTGGCDAKLERQAHALGCSAFLRKPFDTNQLMECIAKAIESAQSTDIR
jgi:FixJ family two-component response regulator